VYFASQRPSLRREIEPSPLPRLPTILSLHQLPRLDAQRVSQLAYRARLRPLLAGFKAAYRVESYPRHA
jgi:hypothetical protein